MYFFWIEIVNDFGQNPLGQNIKAFWLKSKRMLDKTLNNFSQNLIGCGEDPGFWSTYFGKNLKEFWSKILKDFSQNLKGFW